jgi:hypothetical protein
MSASSQEKTSRTSGYPVQVGFGAIMEYLLMILDIRSFWKSSASLKQKIFYHVLKKF